MKPFDRRGDSDRPPPSQRTRETAPGGAFASEGSFQLTPPMSPSSPTLDNTPCTPACTHIQLPTHPPTHAPAVGVLLRRHDAQRPRVMPWGAHRAKGVGDLRSGGGARGKHRGSGGQVKEQAHSRAPARREFGVLRRRHVSQLSQRPHTDKPHRNTQRSSNSPSISAPSTIR